MKFPKFLRTPFFTEHLLWLLLNLLRHLKLFSYWRCLIFFSSFLVARKNVSGTLVGHFEMANSLVHFFAFVLAAKPIVDVNSNEEFFSEKSLTPNIKSASKLH